MPTLFLIVLVDLIGFGLVIPLLPFYALRFAASPQQVTVLLAVYALMQLFTAPLWGRLSDRIGRRPVLMVSMAASVAAYFWIGSATALWMLFAARALAGACAGNIAAAQAYIADITKPEDRAKGMGLIGAAFGLGFIIGPAFGGLLAGNNPAAADIEIPAWVAAGLSFVALCGVVVMLRESLPADQRGSRGRSRNRFVAVLEVLRRPVLSRLLGRRRSWLVLTQLWLMAAIVFLGFCDPASSPRLIAIGALMVATASATQDIVIDAFRIESLSENEQAAGMASYVAAYRVGTLASTAGALFLVSAAEGLGFAQQAAWTAGYAAMALLVVVGLVTVLVATEPEQSAIARPPEAKRLALRRMIIAGLIMLATYQLLSWLLPVMTLLAIAFLLALPFTGLEPLWSTRQATAILLTASSALVVLINAGYQDGRYASPATLRYASRTAALVLIPRGQVVSADVKPAPASPAGRYQFFKNQSIGQPNEECLLDTATGKVWKLSFDDRQRGKWVLAVEGPK